MKRLSFSIMVFSSPAFAHESVLPHAHNGTHEPVIMALGATLIMVALYMTSVILRKKRSR